MNGLPAMMDQAEHDYHNARAVERSVIGCMLASEDACDAFVDKLNEADFMNAHLRLVFLTIIEMSNDGDKVDTITVAERMDVRGRLDEIGGLAFLGELRIGVYAVENVDAYAKILVDQRIIRSISVTKSKIDQILLENLTPKEKLEKTESLLMQIGEEHSKGPRSANQAIGDLIDILDERSESSGGITGLSTGFTDLDEITCGLQGGDLIILAGRPSMGKTTLAENIVSHNAFSGKSTLFFSLEMSASQILERTISSRKRIPMQDLRRANLDEPEWSRLTEFIREVSADGFGMFIDDTPSISVNEIRSRSRKHQRRYGLDLIVIDYLQLMTLPNADNQSLRIGEATKAIKHIARELNVPVILLSQLSRKVEERADKRPLMSDLRESGAIEQDADVIIFVYRDEVYNSDSERKGVAELLIRKQRMGPQGDVLVSFEGEFCRFKERSDNYWDN
jgi:replicative DNA helicase